jgi:L-lactate permease
VELQFDNTLSNATSSLFQQELAQQLNLNVQQVQVTFNGSTGSRLGLQFASQSPLIVTAAMGPLTGSSFPADSSLKIRTAIVSYEVVFSSAFGNYTLLSLYPPLGKKKPELS